MKSLCLAFAVALLAVALVACSSTATTAPATSAPTATTAAATAAPATATATTTDTPGTTAGVVNPMINYDSLEELNEAVGVTMVLPEDAEDPVFSSIEDTVAQAVFTMDGIEYCLRLAPGSALEDISGMYLTDATEEDMTYEDYSYQIFYDADGLGYALWYDTLSEVSYSVSMDSGATQETLQSIAEMLIPAG